MQINNTLVFFIYGLAFFSMGLVMLLESGRTPLLAEGRVLRPLGIFGLVHGIHEWLEMFLARGEWLSIEFPWQMAWLRLAILFISFVCLLAFALRVLQPKEHLSQQEILGWGFGIAGYTLLVILLSLGFHIAHTDVVLHIDVMARYLLAIPGAGLAALALHKQATQARQASHRNIAQGLEVAAIAFGLYTLTQLFVPYVDFFPAFTFNSTAFLRATGFPIQAVRAVLAVAITVSLFYATQAADEERQRQFVNVQQSRLAALEQIRKDLLEREAMRRELMRHTVIAQEEERARIARELHDETAQVLTAFSLHLAALREALPGERRTVEQFASLQSLSRQMSDGIYRLVHDLRPAQLDDLGLIAALQWLGDEERRRSGLEVKLHVKGQRQRLDPLVETVLFRIAQEALTNVVRHAQVKAASMQLAFETEQVTLVVKDSGIGFDVTEDQLPPRGWGLAGMRERAESVGGQLNLYSVPGQGTTVESVIFFKDAAETKFDKTAEPVQDVRGETAWIPSA